MIDRSFAIKTFFISALLALVLSFVFLHGSKAYANTCAWGNNANPTAFCGYFSGQNAQYGRYVFNNGLHVYSAGALIATLEGYIAGCNGSQNEVGASFIILTMMGVRGQQGNGGPTCHTALNYENAWAHLIRQYSNLGLIQWRTQINYDINTFYTPNGGGDIEAYYGFDSGGVHHQIVFYSPFTGRRVYAIQRLCGNPVGRMGQLPQPNVKISGLVYYYNGRGSVGLSGVHIRTCTGAHPVSDGRITYNGLNPAGGGYNFTLNSGGGFCVVVPNTYTAPNGGVYGNPTITPNYIENGGPPGGNPPPGEFCTNPFTGRRYAVDPPPQSSYEEQAANTPASPGGCDYRIGNNYSYNIAYNSYSAPDNFHITTTSITVNLTGNIVRFATSTGATLGGATAPYSLNSISYVGTYYIAHANGSVTIISKDNETLNFPAIGQPGLSTDTYTTGGYPVSGLGPGDQICGRYTVEPQQGNMTATGNPIPGTTSGLLTSNADCVSVSNHPYARFYGNDVMSGVNFNASELSCNTAGIQGYGGSAGTQSTGSGSQFAALSLGQISNFTSAFLNSAIPQSPTGFSFANSQLAGPFGLSPNDGNFGSSCLSEPNYYANIPQNTPKTVTSNYSISNIGGNILITPTGGASSYLTLSSAGPFTGSHAIFVDGNVYIDSNMQFANSGSINLATGQIQGVPSLYVIALGNVYIGPNVTHLDGVYIAENQCDIPNTQPNCAGFNPMYGGEINTCGNPVTNSVSSSNPDASYINNGFFTNCSQQLDITGSFIDHETKLNRTFGSLHNSTNGENPFSGAIKSCSAGNGSIGINWSSPYGCSAEVFNFSPLTYLGQPSFDIGPPPTYDSIVSLPPVF